MNSREISIWIDEPWYKALSKQLNGQKLSEHLDGVVVEMCKQLIPKDEYERIDKEIREERQRTRDEIEATRLRGVLCVVEDDNEVHFSANGEWDLLRTARIIRDAVKDGWSALDCLENRFRNREELSREQFDKFAAEYKEGSRRITGVFEIDFDSGIFSALHPTDGWQSYSIRDVSTAAYHAYRKHSIPAEQREDILLEKLEGKQIVAEPTQGNMEM